MHYFLTTVLLAISLTLTAQNFEIRLKEQKSKRTEHSASIRTKNTVWQTYDQYPFFTTRIALEGKGIPILEVPH